MKKKLSAFFGALGAFALTATLSGCGLGGQDITDSDEPITMSQAFNTEGIWFKSGEPAKDTTISDVYVFDGKGNVTVYDVWNGDRGDFEPITYTSLKGLSDEEILTLVKEKAKEYAEADNQENIELAKELIEYYTSVINLPKDTSEDDIYYVFDELIRGDVSTDLNTLTRTLEEDLGLETFYPDEMNINTLIDFTKPRLDVVNQKLSELEAFKYTEPEPQPIKLSIRTDKTGNSAKYEELTAGKGVTFKAKADELLYSNYPVYDMYFNGYEDLYTRVSETHAGFILDTPDTEGIEVD